MLSPFSQLFPPHRTSARPRRVGAAALLLTLLAVLAFSGCSGDDSDGGAGGDGAGASTDGTDAPSGDASADGEEGADGEDGGEDGGAGASDVPSLPSAPEIARPAGATDDLGYDLTACPTKAGTVSLRGTVKNPTKKPAGYSITFSWLDDEAQVVGRGVAVLKKVEPGATARWRMDATVGKGATQCVPNVLRGTIAAKS